MRFRLHKKVGRPRGPVLNIDLVEVARMYAGGMSVAQIGRKLGVSADTIRMRMIAGEVPRRPVGRPVFLTPPAPKESDAAPAEPVRVFCEQCERRVRIEAAKACRSQWCKAA